MGQYNSQESILSNVEMIVVSGITFQKYMFVLGWKSSIMKIAVLMVWFNSAGRGRSRKPRSSILRQSYLIHIL
jgi:hypothetical protein